MKERQQNAARELLPAIGYGDAAGLPVETKNAQYICDTYGYINELKVSVSNPFYGGQWDAGSTSDDTQLSQAVAQSIIENDGFSLMSLAEHHLDAYRNTPRVQRGDKTVVRGWGGSTTHSMERLEAGISPENSGEKDGAGNGIIMKMAPLVVWQALAEIDNESRLQQYDAFTTMTHDSDIARLCTRIHGEVLSQVIETGDLASIPKTMRQMLAGVNDFSADTSLLLRAVNDPCQSFDALVERYAGDKGGFKYGFYVPETLAIVYDIALGSGGDFETAVFRAVNLGGDSDSTASTIASMIACASGGEYAKPHDMENVQDIAILREISNKLARVATKGDKS